MNRQKWLLLVLDSGRSLSPIQLQKSLFLISKEIPETIADDFYYFVPDDYGPFDSAIYTDAYELQEEGLAIIDNPLARGWRRYSITDEGSKKANEIAINLPSEVIDKINEIVSWVVGKSFSELVRSIYQKYPEQRANSVFRG